MRPIDADELKKWIEEYHTSNWGIPQDELIYAIGSAPTIESAKHGKWKLLPSEVVSDDGLWGETRYVCSNCGKLRHFPYPYCPICGAKMERSEE